MVCKNTQKGFLLFTLLKKWAKTNQNVCRRVRTSSCVLEFTSDASQTRGPSAHARRGSDWRVFLPYILWHERMCVWCMGCFSFNTDVLFFFFFFTFLQFLKRSFRSWQECVILTMLAFVIFLYVFLSSFPFFRSCSSLLDSASISDVQRAACQAWLEHSRAILTFIAAHLCML